MNTEEQVGGTREERAKWTSEGEKRNKEGGAITVERSEHHFAKRLGELHVEAVRKVCYR